MLSYIVAVYSVAMLLLTSLQLTCVCVSLVYCIHCIHYYIGNGNTLLCMH